MRGRLSGVQARITSEYRKSIFIYCAFHLLNLAVQKCSKEILMMRNALDTIHEPSKLIQISPKRRDLFEIMKLSCDLTGSALRPLCPTRWTAKVNSFEWVLHNYEAMLEALLSIATCLEVANKASGVNAKLETLDLFFCHSGFYQVLFINRSPEYNLSV